MADWQKAKEGERYYDKDWKTIYEVVGLVNHPPTCTADVLVRVLDRRSCENNWQRGDVVDLGEDNWKHTRSLEEEFNHPPSRIDLSIVKIGELYKDLETGAVVRVERLERTPVEKEEDIVVQVMVPGKGNGTRDTGTLDSWEWGWLEPAPDYVVPCCKWNRHPIFCKCEAA